MKYKLFIDGQWVDSIGGGTDGDHQPGHRRSTSPTVADGTPG